MSGSHTESRVTHSFSRRRLLSSAAAAAAASALPAWFIERVMADEKPHEPTGPNDKPGIALVGCGGRGRSIANEAKRFGRFVAVCDVDVKHMEGAGIDLKAKHQLDDFRKVMERNDVDVVLTATPDHWHTLVNLAALRAGKDVYSEKPLTLTIGEGKKLVETVKQTERILQTGSQQRSDPQFRMVCELVRNGRVGKLKKVTTILPAGLRKGPFKSEAPPAGLNWDMWLGQAPLVPYVKERCHTTFRFWYDYSGGTITDWGAHHNDIALWGAGLDHTGPISVEAERLAEPIPGGYTAVSDYRVNYRYANGLEHVCQTTPYDSIFGSELGQPPKGERRNGVVFEGTDGWIYIRRGFVEASDPDLLKQELPASAERLYVSNDHMGNFFNCVRSRKQPIAPAEVGHRSVSVCHLGALALRLKRKLQWDPEKQVFVSDDEANRFVNREMRAPWSLEK